MTSVHSHETLLHRLSGDLRNKKKMQLHVTEPLNTLINIVLHMNNYRRKRPAEDDQCVPNKAIKLNVILQYSLDVAYCMVQMQNAVTGGKNTEHCKVDSPPQKK